MHLEYFPVHRHIDDRIYDNSVHLLIAHKYETFPEDNAIYNHRLHDARKQREIIFLRMDKNDSYFIIEMHFDKFTKSTRIIIACCFG